MVMRATRDTQSSSDVWSQEKAQKKWTNGAIMKLSMKDDLRVQEVETCNIQVSSKQLRLNIGHFHSVVGNTGFLLIAGELPSSGQASD